MLSNKVLTNKVTPHSDIEHEHDLNNIINMSINIIWAAYNVDADRQVEDNLLENCLQF